MQLFNPERLIISAATVVECAVVSPSPSSRIASGGTPWFIR